MWCTILKFTGAHKLLLGAGLALAIVAAFSWAGYQLYSAGYDAAERECKLSAMEASIDEITEVANTNASVAVEAKAAGDAKAKVLATRVNKNWERSERLNNTIYRELANAPRSDCHVSDVPVLERALEWVRADTEGSGAVGAAEGGGGEGADRAPGVPAAAAP